VHTVTVGQKVSVLGGETVYCCCVKEARKLVDLFSDWGSLATLTELRARANDKEAREGDNWVIIESDFFALRGSASAITWNISGSKDIWRLDDVVSDKLTPSGEGVRHIVGHGTLSIGTHGEGNRPLGWKRPSVARAARRITTITVVGRNESGVSFHRSTSITVGITRPIERWKGRITVSLALKTLGNINSSLDHNVKGLCGSLIKDLVQNTLVFLGYVVHGGNCKTVSNSSMRVHNGLERAEAPFHA